MKQEDVVGPSTVIPIESNSEEDEEDDEELHDSDDPTTDAFWAQFASEPDE